MNTCVASPAFAEIESKCLRLKTEGGDLFDWQPDDRYCAVIAEFTPEHLDRALPLLVAVFGWGKAREDLYAASAHLQEVITSLGGMSRGQIIFSYEPPGGLLLYGAWWPWANGSKISIRVGLDAIDANGDDIASLRRRLFDIFQVEGARTT